MQQEGTNIIDLCSTVNSVGDLEAIFEVEKRIAMGKHFAYLREVNVFGTFEIAEQLEVYQITLPMWCS